MRMISSCGACLRMVSAAITPAGPLPRITCFMFVPPKKRGRSAWNRPYSFKLVRASKPQPLLGLLRRAAFLVPAAHLVVFRQHLVQAVDQPFRGAGLRGLGQKPLRQVIVLVGEAGAIIEFPFHVPHALADLAEAAF